MQIVALTIILAILGFAADRLYGAGLEKAETENRLAASETQRKVAVAAERAKVRAVESARDIERDFNAAVDELDAAIAANEAERERRAAEHAEALEQASDEHTAALDRLADGQAATLGGMADAHAERIEDLKLRHARQLAAVRAEEAEKCGCSWLSPLPPLSP